MNNGSHKASSEKLIKDTHSPAVNDVRIGMPGQYPFTRGVHPAMYRDRLWTIRQYAGFSTAAESNERYRYLLSQGTTGLSVAFDLPTQIGYNSDHCMARGENGRVGVAIDSIEDMTVLFDGINLGNVSTSMTINATAAVLLAMYFVVGESQGIDTSKLRGTVQNDILKEYIARGTYIYPPTPSMRIVTDVIAWCSDYAPKWNPISISGYHIREAGASAAQEIAFTLANAIAYIESAIARGLDVDDFAPRLSFFFAVHTNVFEEVAKFRSARRLYARIMRNRFGAQNPKSCALRCHAQTGGVTLTAQQPDNNVVRVALQSFAAVLGGVQSLHANAKDEAIGLPTEAAAQLAVRTQQIIAHETGVVNAVDPFGGSYYLESLTDQIEAEAEAIIQQIDDMGGMVSAIIAGWPQAQIEHSAYVYGQSIQSGERVIVGVNQYAESNDTKINKFKTPSIDDVQRDLLERCKILRSNVAVDQALLSLHKTSRSSGNLMPAILNAVRNRVTIGEICDVLREAMGEYIL